MPKKDWPVATRIMADLAASRMGREYISADVLRDITAYYYGSSPEALPVLPYYEHSASLPIFPQSTLGPASTMPLVINVKSVQLGGAGGTQFLVCDGERNTVSLLTRSSERWQETVLAEVQVPSRTAVVDYDGDGDKDIIVAVLGHFPPSDRLSGKVLILRQSAAGTFDKEVLLEGVGRVSDARPVDLDGDGDLDLAVSIFGGGQVGELAWLENLGNGRHAKHVLLKGSGALNLSPVDLNADGKPDLVSLISQEHEMIVALINRGKGKFDHVSLLQAPHPMVGFTGMKLVDLDGDKDVDILFTNGDALDLQKDPKPYHGVQWLENKGQLQFQFHDIGRFYGAATAVAGDLDADGDLDVVASSWINDWEDPRRQSLIWFENDGKQNFTRHNIASKPSGIVSLELMDITGDDRLDIVAGVFRVELLNESLAADSKRDDAQAGADNDATPDRGTSSARVILLENAAGRDSALR
ncbi:MAG: VCBS repeat-containing protein [Halioglobus sp.]